MEPVYKNECMNDIRSNEDFLNSLFICYFLPFYSSIFFNKYRIVYRDNTSKIQPAIPATQNCIVRLF